MLTSETESYLASVAANSAAARAAAASPSTWWLLKSWHLVIILCFFSLSIGRSSFQSNGDNSLIAGSQGSFYESDKATAIAQQVIICTLVLTLVIPRWRLVLKTLWSSKAMAAILLLPLASAMWSQDPKTSLKEGISFLISMVFAAYFARAIGVRRQLELLCMTAIIMATSSILVALVLPQYGLDFRTGRQGEWEGMFAGKNVCAMSMFFLLIPLFQLDARTSLKKALKTVAIAEVIFLIAMTKSKTAAAMTALYLVVEPTVRLLAQTKDKRFRLLLLATGTVMLTGACAVAYVYGGALLSSLGRDLTFSGRTQIWSALWESILKRPILGYGYRAFWVNMSGESANVLIAVGRFFGYAHNGYLEVASEIGFLGVGLVLTTVATALWKGAKNLANGNTRYIGWFLGTIVFTIIYNFDEDSLVTRFNLAWVLYVLAYFQLMSPNTGEPILSSNPTQLSSSAVCQDRSDRGFRPEQHA